MITVKERDNPHCGNCLWHDGDDEDKIALCDELT